MSGDVLQALEEIAVASVAITARAIATVSSDLTVLQWRALIVIGADEQGVPIGELATRTGLRPSPASRLARRLLDRGLIAAHEEPTDRRVRRVRLTPAGGRLRRLILGSRSRDLAVAAATLEEDPDAPRVLAMLAQRLSTLAR